MPRTPKSAAAAAVSAVTPESGGAAAVQSAAAAPPIDPAAFYDVKASGRFTYRGISFGSLARTEVDGAFLVELLAAPEGARVASYSPLVG